MQSIAKFLWNWFRMSAIVFVAMAISSVVTSLFVYATQTQDKIPYFVQGIFLFGLAGLIANMFIRELR